jgi:putative transcriptional regulator
MPSRYLGGRLLIASPALRDPNFDRTVVLVLEHNETGAVGVILNRPSDAPVSEIVPAWADKAAAPQVVFHGGPVSPSSAICLGRAAVLPESDGFNPLFAGLGSVDLSRLPEDQPHVDAVRVFAGYAGWASAQLEGEVSAGGWFVVRSKPDDAVAADPLALWRVVLRRQAGAVSLLSTYPEDIDAN